MSLYPEMHFRTQSMINTRAKLLAVCLLLILTFVHSAEAQIEEVSDEQLLDLSLEELLNLTITTVSKKEERLEDAPAIVSVITRAQIQELGVQTVPDIMKYIPGFNVYDNYWKPDIVSSRGAKMPLYNNKILLLVNGISAYDGMALEHYLNLVPIISIERIEIIRGPGSTLYGNNAFSGVINIITKNAKDIAENSTDIAITSRMGSYFTRELGISLTSNSDRIKYHFGANFRGDNGYSKSIVDELGQTGKINYEDDINSLFGSLNINDVTINTGFLFSSYGKFGSLPRHIFGNNFRHFDGRTTYEKFYLNAVYDKQVSSTFSLNAKVRYDWADMNAGTGQIAALYNILGAIPSQIASIDTISVTDPNDPTNVLQHIDTTYREFANPVYFRQRAHIVGGEFQMRKDISDKASLIAGASFETRIVKNMGDVLFDYKSDSTVFKGSTANYPFYNSDFGAYVQLDGKIGKFGYAGGIRATYLELSDKVFFTPRIGFVYSVSSNTKIKALYGQAFRGAGPHEFIFSIPGVVFGPDATNGTLDPEQIRTLELAIDQSFSNKAKVRLNGFYNELFDIIQRDVTTDQERRDFPLLGGARLYRNVSDAKIWGVEAEFNYYWTSKLSFWSNASYKEDINDDIPFMENITANAGINVPIGDKIMVRPNYHLVGEKNGTLTNTDEASIGGYGLFNCVLDYRISESLNFSVQALNVFDKEYFYPEDVRRIIDKVPGGPGRSVFFSLKWGMNVKN